MDQLLFQVRDRLLAGIDEEYNILNRGLVIEVLSYLETIDNSDSLKRGLSNTRLAKNVNELRRKCNDHSLAKQAKGLLRKWKELLDSNETSSNISQSPRSTKSPNDRVISPDINGVYRTTPNNNSNGMLRNAKSPDLPYGGSNMYKSESHKYSTNSSTNKMPVGRPPINNGIKEFRCIMCRPNELFDTKYFLDKHIKQKHVGFSFVCPICPENPNFNSKYFLDKHMKQHHDPSQQMPCQNNESYNGDRFDRNVDRNHHNGEFQLKNDRIRPNFHMPNGESRRQPIFSHGRSNEPSINQSSSLLNIYHQPRPPAQGDKHLLNQNHIPNHNFAIPIAVKRQDNNFSSEASKVKIISNFISSKIATSSNGNQISTHNYVPSSSDESDDIIVVSENKFNNRIISPMLENDGSNHRIKSPKIENDQSNYRIISPRLENRQSPESNQFSNGEGNILKLQLKSNGNNGFISKVRTTQELVEQLSMTRKPSPNIPKRESSEIDIDSESNSEVTEIPRARVNSPSTFQHSKVLEFGEVHNDKDQNNYVSQTKAEPIKEEEDVEISDEKEKETVEDVLARLPPIHESAYLDLMKEYFENDENEVEMEGLIPIKREINAITGESVDRLHTEFVENLNGNVDSLGEFKEWHEVVSRMSFTGDILPLLPYCIID